MRRVLRVEVMVLGRLDAAMARTIGRMVSEQLGTIKATAGGTMVSEQLGAVMAQPIGKMVSEQLGTIKVTAGGMMVSEQLAVATEAVALPICLGQYVADDGTEP
jgi:hypothetical protein